MHIYVLNKRDFHIGIMETLGHFKQREDAVAKLPKEAVKIENRTSSETEEFWEMPNGDSFVSYRISKVELQ